MAELTADLVDHRRNMHIGVGVDTHRDGVVDLG